MVALKVIRKICNDQCCIGDMYLNNTLFAHTLEPVDRGLTKDMSPDTVKSLKVQYKTAIPTGEYSVSLYDSPKHKMVVPLIEDVPGFDMVEIHIGNFPQDTEACILVGQGVGLNRLVYSKNAFDMLMTELKKTDKITLEIWKLHD